ncbi:hypothetical protein BH09PLA1_BH09PLA1_20740 [soil metagenome]
MSDPFEIRLQQVFSEVLSIPPAERSKYLDRAVADDAALRNRIEALLVAHDRAGKFLDAPAVSPHAATVAPAGHLGERIGHYKLLEMIGEGGFATVYRAQQEAPVRREVALKILKLGMDTHQVLARFDAERQALAILDHPNIAKVFDAGTTDTGRPFFVMELVRGLPITTYCDRKSLSTRERLALFVPICRALQHAHQKGIIHRDIKPNNVLVAEQDGKPSPKVIDFGIAKATQARLTEKTLFTELRQLIGTPAYMSPEQAGNEVLDIDTRSDIYSLGVLLYELLTGSTPLDEYKLRHAAYGEIQRMVREEDSPTPSTRISALGEKLASVAAVRQVSPHHLSRLVKGELDWIAMKCLEKDRRRRYESAGALAEDLLRHLAGEAVAAGPPSALYRIRKTAARHRLAVTVSSTFLVAAGIGVSLYIHRIGAEQQKTLAALGDANQQRFIAEQRRAEAQKQEEEAKSQAAIALAVSQFQTDMLTSADPGRLLGDKVTVLQAVTAALKELDAGKLKDQWRVEANVRTVIGDSLGALGRYDQAEPVLRKALDLFKLNLAAGDSQMAPALDRLGLALKDQSRFAEAEPLFREALEINRKSLPAEDPQTATSLTHLAELLREQGKLADAEPLLREALAIDRKSLPAEDPETGSVVATLAHLLRAQRRLEEAEPLYREALEIDRRTLPSGHPRIAKSMNNLAVLLKDQGRLVDAEPLFRQSLETARATLPAGHPHIATALNNLALLLQAQGKLADAEPLFRESLEICRTSLPAGHSYIAISLNSLALLLKDGGRFDEAEPLFREALEIRRKSLAAGHPLIGQSLFNLADLLQAQARLPESEALFREALLLHDRALGSKAGPTTRTANALAELLDRTGRQDDASALRERYQIKMQTIPASPATRASPATSRAR